MDQFVQQLVFGLANGAIYAVIAVGFALSYRTIRLLNLSHQQFVMFGGLLGYSAVTSLRLPLPLAIVLVPLAMALLSILVERVVIRPIRLRQADPVNMIIATLGVGVVMTETARLLWGGAPLSYPGFAKGTVLVAGVHIANATLIVLATVFFVVVLLQLFLTRTWTGRGLRATAEHWRAAQLVGISVGRTVTITFAITGALGGLAGVLISWLYVATFTLGDLGLKALAGAVLGGFGSLPGAMVGGLVLGVSENLFSVYAVSNLATLFVFALLIVILLVWPRGLFGVKVSEAR
jgi:branched-chain amino acid transport system permease protein